MNKIEESPFKGKTGIPRLINAFGYSVDGFKAAFKNEDAFRQELFLAAVLVPLGLYLGKTGVEKALLVSVVEPSTTSSSKNSPATTAFRPPQRTGLWYLRG